MKSATTTKPSTKPILYINLRPFIIVGLSAVIFFPPFLRGLFFQPETLITLMISAAVFLLFALDTLLSREDTKISLSWLDLSILGLVLAYVLSLINSVNIRATVGEILELLNAAMIYWMVSRHIKGPTDIERILKVIFFAAVGVAIVGLGAATGHITYPGAFDGKIIMSTFQYRNSLAAYLAMASVIGLTLWVKQSNPFKMHLYATGNLLLLVTLLATQSRGGWIVYPFGIFLLFLGVPKELIWRAIYYFFINLGMALPVSKLFLARVLTQDGIGGLKILILSVVLVLLIQLVIWFSLKFFEDRPIKPTTYKLMTGGGLVYIAIILLVYFFYSSGGIPTAGARFMPVQVIQRANTISGTDTSFQARMIFNQDALKIIKDYPLLGTGAGGWEALYHSYQNTHYFTTEVHNHFLQVWVETGTIGFLAFLSIWVALGIIMYRLWRYREDFDDYWLLIWTAAISAVALGFHSFFDFNLSLYSLVIILWSIFGVVRAGEKQLLEGEGFIKIPVKIIPKKNWQYGLALIFVAATLFIPAKNFYSAGKIGALASQALAAQNIIEAKPLMEKASKLDPYTASYKGDLMQIYTLLGIAKNDGEMIKAANKYGQEAVKLKPYDFKLRSSIAAMYFLQGDLENYLKETEFFLKIDPLEISLYEQVANALLIVAQKYQEMGNPERANLKFEKLYSLLETVEAKTKEVDVKGWMGSRLEVTPKLRFAKGQTLFLEKKYREATIEFESAAQTEMPPEGLSVWLAAAYTKLNEEARAKDILNKITKDKDKALDMYESLLEK